MPTSGEANSNDGTQNGDDGPAEQPAGWSQAAAVREALRAGHDKPSEAILWIRDQLGLEVSRAAFSAVKTKEAKRTAAGNPPDQPRRPGRPRSGPPVAPPTTPSETATITPTRLRTSAEVRHSPLGRPSLVIPPPPRAVDSTPTPPKPATVTTDKPDPASRTRPAPGVESGGLQPPTDAATAQPMSWRELLQDLREIKRLKAKYGDEFPSMVEEV